MSITPRTDAVQFLDQSDYHDPSAVDWFVRADFARTLETELAAAKAELARFKDSTWEHDEFNRKNAVARSVERDNDKDELARLRAELKELSHVYELNKVSIDELDADRARAERAEAALAFIASNGGTTHETECGPISCNGSWCAEQARAAIAAAMKP